MSNDVMSGAFAELFHRRPDGVPALVHELFAGWARETPSAVAVGSPRGVLTYGELEARSNRLAHHLRSLGVGPEVRVAVCAGRTPERVVGILAVLKAGGAYLSLDPEHPAERLAFQLEDARVPVVLTQEGSAGRLPASALTIDLDRAGELAGDEDRPPAARVGPENLAYVIYTSGSTGLPKGVEVPHAGLLNLVRWHQDFYAVTPEDRSTQIANPAFDASVWELWPYLTAGAGSYIPDEETRVSPPALAAWWEELGITLSFLPTPLAEAVLDALPAAGISLPRLRALIVGGDRLHRRPEPGTGFALVNHYGPSEYSVVTTAGPVPPAAQEEGLPPIGLPIDKTRVHVLDPEGRPVPAGEPGELYVAGAGLARGYLARPGLTAERFVPDPWSPEPGGRMYRTGDRVRSLPDGRLDFLGRVDHQVKIRGFRVELGEIEAVLESHPAVAGNVVTALEAGDSREKFLAAYVVPRPGTALSIAELRGHLRKRLAEYMVPARFVVMEALPLTPNGKVDRNALPRPDLSAAREGAVAPRTPLEAVLGEIWSEVLGIPGVGVGENFFELGGHSLLAARAIARVQEALGRRLPPRALFEAPTIELLAARLADLPAGEEMEEIPAAADRRWIPSIGQEGMWFAERMSPELPVYTVGIALDLAGPLDPGALHRALAGLVRRHETLRAVFSEVNGRPELTLADAAVGLPRIDLWALPAAAREGETKRIEAAFARAPFPLDRAPLLRSYLVERDERDHLLLIHTHHIVADDWSTWVLAHDLAALYAAEAVGRPAALPELPLQFSDYAVWQRGWLEGAEAREQIEYWRRHLDGIPEAIDLPFDRPRSPARSPLGDQIAAAVPGGDIQALLGVALRGEATLFMALLTVLDVLLHRYSGQADLTVGVQAANRHRSGTQSLIGYFTNTLVLRAELREPSSFRESLARTRESMLAGIGRQDIPFDLLVRELGAPPSLVHAPLAQVFLSFQNTPPLPSELGPGLGLKARELSNGTSKVDFALYLRQEEGTILTVWEYAAALFDPATVERMARHFQVLLAAAAADPGSRIADLPLLTGEERAQLLAGFNDTGSTSGPDLCLHQLFEAQAARVPDAVALTAPDGRLTYRELDERAERLARRLRALGLGPEKLAGVLMDRTADLIVSLLAVHKAGGAYVPLDPGYPRQRVLLMLETARATVLVTRRPLAAALGEELPETVFLDPGWEREPVEEAVLPGALPDNLAYVIFTSGSTGVPKGVAIQHRNAVSMVRWSRSMYSPEEYAGVLVSTSVCFDMSVFEIFATLAAGGRLVLAENALALPELAARDEVVLVDTVPSAMAELLRMGGIPSTIRTVNLGGEPLKASLVREIYDRLPGVERVINLYGPSEDTTFTSYAVVPRDAGRPLIGRPLTGEQAYVLDGEMRPVPIGVPGALYMGGEGVTRGYLHRPDLTAERYVPNPYGPPGSRLYTVGDLVRYLPTGELDFLGRLDHQVKVRGFRIELGEIEAALTRHPEVREAAVLAVPDAVGGNRLIAYVETGRDLPAGELRAHLQRSLPDYMVPSAFALLRELPLTPNGKIDRRALAAVPLPGAPAETEVVTPRSPVEEGIAAVWREVLGIGPFSVHADFFELGGHSLLATQALSKVRGLFGVEIPLRRLFEQPTVAGLGRLVEEGLRGGRELAIPPIVPAPRTGPLPLSFAQQRLWFLDRMAPGSTAYNLPLTFRVRAALDADLLERALAAVVRRHEVLRTTFAEVDGEPRQVIHPEAEAPLARAGLAALEGGSTEDGLPQEVLRWIAREMARPFDLAAGPLLRAAVWSLAADDHVLLIVLHHIVFDGWSLGLLLKDLAAAYEALLAGGEAALAPLPIQYADFALWQQRELVGRLDGQLAYWKRQLADAPQVLDLPGDHPRPSERSFRGGLVETELPAELTRAVRDLAHRRRATPFMLLLAAFEALLERYSRQQDFLVGSPVANRNRPETEGLIGFFVNTLVLRADLAGDPSFADLLDRTREVALDAYAAQDLPFERLVEELNPERDAAYSPLFQVMLVVQSSIAASAGSPHLPLQAFELAGQSAKFDLTLSFEERGDALPATLEYAVDLFEPATIQRMADHLRTLLEGATAEPARRLSELPLLSGGEREQILRWSGAPGAPPRGLTLQAMFAAQAARTPGLTAVLAEGGALTYAELDDRSSRLARYLRRLGVGPGTLVGLCLERSLEMVVALYGVLKAGGAYVPLDPEYPAERLAMMFEDSGIRVVLTQRKLLAVLPEPGPESVLCLDADGPAIMAVPPASAFQDAGEESLAYVIFTSGSTGRPKGAAIPQRAIVNHMLWMQEEYPLEPGDRVLQKTPFSFDASVWEFHAPLLAGATLVMAVPGGQREPAYLADAIQGHGITIFQAVPALLRAMLDYGRMGECRSLRRVFCGGEALTADIQRDFFATLDAELVNLYGPTETAIEILSWRCDPARSDRPALLGRPVTHCAVHVLGPRGELCPLGVPGEICIGGPQVGRGYLDRPAETALRFVPDPFADEPGSRLYRSGDLGRRLPGGALEFLGRIDTQVKVRGFRIELGEIESALASHPRVAEAAVLAGGQQLSAYVAVRRGGPPVSAADLRAFLRGRLPDYMAPSLWTLLEALPHTPAGKVDRRALARLQPIGEERREAGVGPRDAVEKTMAEAWTELGLAVSGVHDNFFDLGGHSLLATRLVSRIRRAFGVELAVGQVFATPTVAGLAAAVRKILEAGGAGTVALVGKARASDQWPLSFAQRRLWFLEQLDPGLPVYNLPTLLRLRGPLDAGVLDRALVEVVRRHEALRTTFYALGGEPFQEVSPPPGSWLAQVDLTGLPEDRRKAEADRQELAASVEPFDLAAGPLLRAVLLRSGAEESVLAAVIHHIATDGWSTGILLEEVFALYGAFAAGEPSPLADLPLQYADFALWQRDWLSGEVLAAELDHWRRRLEGAPRLLDLPTDRPRPAIRSTSGRLLSFDLPEALARAARERAREWGATPFMLFLAAFEALLGRYTGQDCLLVGTPVAGRDRAEIEGLIGFFVNTLVLRADLGDDPGFRELVDRAREAALDAQAHQNLPFEKLVEDLQPERSLSHTPLFQAMLVYDGAAPGLAAPAGLAADLLEPELQSSKFDLTLFLGDGDGGLRGALEYAVDLFDEPTMARLAAHFEVLLTGALERPELPLSELPLLTSGEERQILEEWNGGRGAAGLVPVHELFARQAARTPAAPAVRYEDEVLTFGELDERAEALARRLASLGIGPESAVAVRVDRSLAMLVAILGVMKAGGAYVPLDPESPLERAALVLEDCGAHLLLTQEELAGSAPPFPGPVVLMTADGLIPPSEEREPVTATRRPAGLENLAYVIYTSGSTGRPKGVMVEHGQLASYVAGLAGRMALPEGSSFATVSTLAADLGNTVIFASLASGGCLHVISRARLSEAPALAGYCERHPVDCLKIVPSHLAALLGDPRGAGCLPRRLLIVGGEAISPSLVERVRELAPTCRILNHYGPTETTVGVLTHEVGATGRIPLGRPFAGTRVLALGRGLHLVPVGVPGELHVGGPQVSRGYLGRPDLTAERFRPDPWGALHGEPGGRVYATGDRGRHLPDGTIEFLGRVDFQLKVRGYRVEPGEVEAALRAHPAVVAAVVTGRGQTLVAYLVADPLTAAPEPAELRAFLKDRLPDPLVPSAWVLLPALPLTPNGKVDRKALPPPEEAHAAPVESAPRTPTEERLAAIWADVLRLGQVGVHESFFELGGHSLLAIQVVSRVRDAFGVELPVRQIFETPTVAGLAAVLDSASDLVAVGSHHVEPAGRDRLLPASFVQESLWFLHLLEPESPVYNSAMAWRLSGRLSGASLEAGLEALVRRHESLRTRFVELEGLPYQEIAPSAPVPLPRIDLSGLPAEAREEELPRLLRMEAGGPFDLSRGPLLRARLAVLGTEEHVLLLTVHHAVFDGWSKRILTRELAALYAAAGGDREPRLPALPVQYADYAVWQRRWLGEEVLGPVLAWWLDELKGAPTVLELPTDRPRPPAQSFRGAWDELEVPAGPASAVLELGRRQGATPFIILLALFQTLLHRLSGQDDLLIGTPVGNRPRPELEPLIGYFVDTAVLRSRFDGAETFPRRLARVRQTALGVFSHQHLPFSRLAAALPTVRDLSRNPVFQVLFSLDAEPPGLDLPGLSALPLPTGEPAAKFDLSFGAVAAEDRLGVSLEYNLDLFDAATARRLLESFSALLAAVAADPLRRLDEIPLLAEAEIRELTLEARRSAVPPAAPRRLHDLFAEQAARRPGATALVDASGERWTYGEIDRRSSRLAVLLLQRGVGPETPVGVCLERSPELATALLGVLKAGGVYLPLDPAYPAERLAFMLEDSGAPVALTRRSLAPGLPAGDWEVLALDGPEGALEGEDSGTVPADPALPESLAYLIYTSGSTGRPKGVGVPHAAAAGHMEAAAGLFGLHEEDRVLWFASPSFDISMEEVLAPWSRGAAVVLRGDELWPPDGLLDRVRGLGVTVMDLPTAYWHQWAAELERSPRPDGLELRLVTLGGEAMSAEAARRWLRSPLAGIRLLNLYGPTEAVVTATGLEVDEAAANAPGGTVPIGRPLAGRSAWVLDRSAHPAPAGADGELCLGGPLLARGYLGRPDLTAERFVPDPFAGEPGARLYRTGDLARRGSGGVLEFRGRVDRQLKVRGFRVEPGEIESLLARHPGVREAVVDARPDPEGGQRLIAWIVPSDPAPAAEELAGFLRGALPGHLVPSAFVQVGELPLTTNGKVDRRSLPDPGALADGGPEAGLPPRTPAEERLAGIWRQLLGISRIGIQDDFFALGGHSLLATRLLSRIREDFGVELSLRELFADTRLETLASRIERDLEARGEPLGAAPGSPARQLAEERPLRWPASFSQRSLWLIDRLQPVGGAYNLSDAIRFTGDLDPTVLGAALSVLALRHEGLRTRFVEVDGEPWQEILPAKRPEMPLIDLSDLAAEAAEAEALRLALAEAGRSFDLAAGHLLRARLLRLAPGEHLFLLTLHHVVTDGWSDEVLTRELATLYAAGKEGRAAELPPLPVQYADYAARQREELRGEALEESLAVWLRRLDGVPALDLPSDRQRPPVWSFRGDFRSSSLEKVPAADLERLARAHGATPFMLLLATLEVLLGRYAGQEDFAVGTPSANRTRSELENVVGFFVNMLPLRADLSGGPGFREILARVRDTALEAFSHQGIPFELLVERLAPERDLGRNPIFQVVLQLAYAGSPAFPGFAARRVDLQGSTAKFDLNLAVSQENDRLALYCEYPTDLYEGTTIRRLLGHFETLLAGAVADPERSWRELPLLTGEEREQLLAGFNDTGSTAGPDLCLHQLFEAQAARVPDETALIAPDARLTYRELDARATRLAKRLRALGLGPERLAGVLMDRTADLIVALLAVQKAGGAYAPLDPNYPKQRVRLMLETARATVLITRRHLAEELQEGMRTVFLDPGWDDEPVEEVALPAVLPENLAYVIFTSGSTGVPKGVAIQHRSAVSMVRWCHTMFSPEEYAGVLVSTSICFDMSVFEIFATLAAGGRLILAENALALPELAAKNEVVLVDTVPSAMAELLRMGRLPSTIRTVNLGGEPLKSSLVREIYEKLPSVERVVNLYGPSEDTTFTSYAVVPRESEHPLIGRPLTGEQAYVLDGEMRPVPIGVPGALYMGGEGVTRGYLYRPELTAERYIPNPYGPPGSRLYTVGDLVRYLPTGELDYLGRLDHQVKVRGFRIELGEIESALTRHPEVREAAVLATEDVLGGNRLIAYVETERELPAADLRAHLKQSLPDYMVPSIFALLRELPLTPNGKIDRRALAAMPLQEDGVDAGKGRAPRGSVEEVLAGIWSDVFGREVGVEEDFFDLGGHSLLATRVVSRIREAFGIELPLRRLFEQPTIAGLARVVEAALGAGAALDRSRIEPAPRSGLLPLSLAQQRLWFLDRLEPGTATFNLPAPLRLRGRVDVAALSRAVDEIVRRHESLRTVFGEREGHGYQEVRPPAPVPLPLVDLSGLPAPEPEAERRAEEEARRPFDLVRGPLLRTTLLKLGDGDWLLLITQHHIVSDGWSTGVFARELRTLHDAFAAGRPSPLPELPVQYPDYAVWQRRALNGEAVGRLLEEWKRRFGTALPPLDLPTDRPRPPVQTYPGAHRQLQLPAALAGEVRKLAQGSGATLFMTLLGAFQALLHRYSGQERIAVGSPVAGRNRPELEGLIGFFVNTLVLPGDLSGDLSFRQLLERSREMALGAYACQELPFEKLVEVLLPVRDKSRSPLFQAMFLLHQEPAARGKEGEGGIRIEPAGVGTGTSQFDLTLYASDTPEGLFTGVEYNTDLFDAATMDRLLENYRALLEAAVADPGVKVGEVPLALPERKEAAAPVLVEVSSEAAPDARRDRLSSRLSKLSAAQREALERRLKGGSGG